MPLIKDNQTLFVQFEQNNYLFHRKNPKYFPFLFFILSKIRDDFFENFI
jgi:hypothetical protein